MSIKLTKVFIVFILIAAIAAGCANPIASDSENGPTSEGPGIEGTLAPGESPSARFSAYAGNPDWETWIVVMLSWDADFEVPNLFVDMFGDEEDVSFDYWSDARAFAVDEDGSFSIDEELPDRFVLFAVDTAEELDPVQGLIGIRGEDYHWLTVHGDLVQEERIHLGEIRPSEDGLVWVSDLSIDEASDQAETHSLALIDEGTRLLKNVLSLNFNFARDGQSASMKEGDDPWLFATPYHIFDEYREHLEDLDGQNDSASIVPADKLVAYVSMDEGTPVVVFSDEETQVTLEHSGYDLDELDLTEFEDSGIFLNDPATPEVANDNNDDPDHTEPWIVTDRDRAVYLGSGEDYGPSNSRLPVPTFEMKFDDSDSLVEVAATDWYWFTTGESDGKEYIDETTVDRILAGYGVALRYEDGPEAPQDIVVTGNPNDAVAIGEELGHAVLAPGSENSDDDKVLTAVDINVMLDTTGIMRMISWEHTE